MYVYIYMEEDVCVYIHMEEEDTCMSYETDVSV